MGRKAVFILIGLVVVAGLVAAYIFFLAPKPGPSAAEKLFIGKVVHVTGSLDCQGVVEDFSEGEYIVIRAVGIEGNTGKVFHKLSGNYSIAILADSAEQYDLKMKEAAAKQAREREASQRQASLTQKDGELDAAAAGELAAKEKEQKDKIKLEEANRLHAAGLMRIARTDFAGALDVFYKVIELQPDNAEAHFYLGLTRLAGGDPTSAIEAFNQAITLREKFYRAHLFRGIAHSLINERDFAVADMLKASETYDVFGHIPKRFLQEDRMVIPGGEIRTSSGKSFKKPTGEMSVDGKTNTYKPVEGGGFMAASMSQEELNSILIEFVRRASREEKRDFLRVVLAAQVAEIAATISDQQQKTAKAKTGAGAH